MSIFVSHKSAYSFWDQAKPFQKYLLRVKATVAQSDDCDDKTAVDVTNLLNLNLPLHIAVKDSTQRHRTSKIQTHLLTIKQGAKDFYRVSDTVYVASPEACYFQLACHLDIVRAALMGLEMCGDYSTWDDAGNTRERDSFVTSERLKEYAEMHYARQSRSPAVRALNWVLDGSRSPMESALLLTLCLPPKYGGYNIPLPVMNLEIQLDDTAKRMSHKSYLKGDLVWPRHHLVVEYNSDQEHTGGIRISQDARRVNALNYIGYRVIIVTKRQLKNTEDIDSLARQIAQATGKRMPACTQAWRAKQRKLYRILFPWWDYLDWSAGF